jgi:hemerythrin-like domain-containing protein
VRLGKVMAITIGGKPESDYSDPLGLLGSCHRRIERFLNALLVIAREAEGGALSTEQRGALEAARDYFRNAAPKHTLDEEESLFPRLRAATDPRAGAALALLDELHADHEAADRLHREVDTLVTSWLAEGKLASEAARRLGDMLEDLSALYREHIAVEEDQVFPLASRLLSRAELERMGHEMAARRGTDPATICRPARSPQ